MPVTVGYAIADVTALKALDTSTLVDGYSRFVISLKSWVVYISSATGTGDNLFLITPNSGTGRWISQKTLENSSVGDAQVGSLSQSKITNLISDLAGKASLVHTHNTSDINNLDNYTSDRVNTTLVAGSGTTLNYDNTLKKLTVSMGGSGSTGFIADTMTINSPSLAPGASSIVSYTGYGLVTARKVITNFPARVRVYITNAFASADNSRSITTEPTGNHGCLLEIVTINSLLTIDLTPAVQLYTIENPTNLYFNFTNLDSVNRSITATFNIYRW